MQVVRERWLYHLVTSDQDSGDPYAPPSLAAEGFIHCSYQPSVLESARLYFSPESELHVLQIDPRRVNVPLEEAQTPRGKMPHLHGPLRRDAVAATLTLAEVAGAPDTID